MNKNKILLSALLIPVLFNITGCNKEEDYSNQPIEKVEEIIPEELKTEENTFVIDDTELSLPARVEDFYKKGFKVSNATGNLIESLEPNQEETVILLKENKIIEVKAKNFTEDTISLDKAIITRVDLEDEKSGEVKKDNLRFKESRKDVLEKLEQDHEEINEDVYKAIVQIKDKDKNSEISNVVEYKTTKDKQSVLLYFDNDDNLQKISILNHDIVK